MELVVKQFLQKGEFRKALNLLEIHINNSGFVTPFFLKFSSRDFSKSWEIETVGIMGKLKLN